MSESNGVCHSFRNRAGHFYNDLALPWALSGAAKIVISYGTSSKNALIKLRGSETIAIDAFLSPPPLYGSPPRPQSLA